MARMPRALADDMVYHVINRANQRVKIFNNKEDYQLFEEIISAALEIYPMRILAYCLMPNHWHFVLYPQKGEDLPRFMGWLTNTHTRRYHSLNKTIGYGHLYQGRYKSFPVEKDNYCLHLIRYVERNPKRAALVDKAEDWPWSSLHKRIYGAEEQKKMLSPWPIEIPDDYLDWINQSQSKEEIENIRYALKRNRPYGSETWTITTAQYLGLEASLNPRGRPRKGD